MKKETTTENNYIKKEGTETIVTHTHNGHTHTHVVHNTDADVSSNQEVTKSDSPIASDHEHSTDHHHEHTHEHHHEHHHENTKAVLNRMNRAIGHMEAVRAMIEDGRDCSEVLVQIAAVRSAINNIGKIILEDHINHCVVDAIETGDEKVIHDLNEAIKKFVK